VSGVTPTKGYDHDAYYATAGHAMSERTATTIEASATEAEEEQADAQARMPPRRRRSPQFDKCLEAIDALQSDGTWLLNGTREEQYDSVRAWLTAKGYALNWLPSRPTFSRAARAHERDHSP
jgi:hypothetical protein